MKFNFNRIMTTFRQIIKMSRDCECRSRLQRSRKQQASPPCRIAVKVGRLAKHSLSQKFISGEKLFVGKVLK